MSFDAKKAASEAFGQQAEDEYKDWSRWVSLDDYLDGNYVPPQPSVGAARDDGVQLLYPGMWHTLIGLTETGKTTFALWQVRAVLQDGGQVIYVHFEEANPNGILHRLMGLGVDRETIRKQFHFASTERLFVAGEVAYRLTQLEQAPTLAVLDGINAACGMQGWSVKEPESVGQYRAMFVHPLASTGCTVLSLGHPVKDMKRQGESYSYGAAGWLNDVDGASFQLKASSNPIRKGASGSSALTVVKDRYSEVKPHGELQTDKEMPQYYMGQFIVDDDKPEDSWGIYSRTAIRLSEPAKNEEGDSKDQIDIDADKVTEFLRTGGSRRFEGTNALYSDMKEAGYKLSKNNIALALKRLVRRQVIEWPEVPERRQRPGWLIDITFDPEGDT